ncbi:MAG: hypothetical protein Q7J12_06680, partial [Syntrophales bacterium]|nr:hypothetical protein [Syntrophales bacterium]
NLAHLSMTICPMLDAGKKDIYTAPYRMGRNDIPEKTEKEKIVNIGNFLENLDKNEDIIFVGNGAVKHRDFIKETLPGKSFFASSHHQFIRAAAVGLLGLRKFNDGDILDFINFTPLYLRPSQAQLKAFPKEKQEKY